MRYMIPLMAVLIWLPCISQSPYCLRSCVGCGARTSINETGAFYVSSSIGQVQTLGSSEVDDMVIQQGFQQPLLGSSALAVDVPAIQWKVFPNPFSDHIELITSDELYCRWTAQLRDLQGRSIQLWQLGVGGHELLQMPILLPGVYLLELRGDGQTHFQRILRS